MKFQEIGGVLLFFYGSVKVRSVNKSSRFASVKETQVRSFFFTYGLKPPLDISLGQTVGDNDDNIASLLAKKQQTTHSSSRIFQCFPHFKSLQSPKVWQRNLS